MASQHTATVECTESDDTGRGSATGGATTAGANVRPAFDRFFVLTDAATGKALSQRRYAIRLPDGRSYEDTTDDEGRTKVCASDESHLVELIVYDDVPAINPNWDQL
ncbi:MAG: hypothetical protein ACXU8N_06645 [Telluria sp.]